MADTNKQLIQADPFQFLGTFSPNYKVAAGWNNFVWFIAFPLFLLIAWYNYKKYSWLGLGGTVLAAIVIPLIISFLKSKQEQALKENLQTVVA
jgi:hypothetical protein